MHKILRSLVPLGILLVAAAPVARASGGSSAPRSTSTPSVSLTPEEQAAQHYNRGLKMRDKAWSFEEKADKAGTDEERAKLEAKAQKQYAKSIEQFRTAIRLMPMAYQAYSSLGYGLRKTGDYSSSLEAYNRALTLKPGYAEAIEYRAEAYLGLNRIEDAKRAYVELFGSDRAKAAELLDAMKGWVQRRRDQPDGLQGAVVDDFAGWVSEREEIAGQTASVSQLKENGW
jgi:tetratricopeptide (TPR) repeat protein